MRIALALSFATLVFGTPLRAQPAAAVAEGSPGGQQLARALALLDVPDYQGALEAINAGLAAPGNDRRTLVLLYELRGIITASLRAGQTALTSFQHVLALEPDFQPTRDYSPRVRGPYLEARAWLADNAPLRFAPLPPQSEQGAVRKVGVAVLSDPLRQARAVRFHLQAPTRAWTAESVPLTDGKAQAILRVPGSGWWAELLGDHEAVLSRVGSREKPIVEAPLTLTRASPQLRTHHLVSLGLWGGAVLSSGVGAWFGAQSNGRLESIRTAERDGEGRIIGLTQREAFALERQSRVDATVANVLFATGAALAAGGVTTWFFGGAAAVTPTGVRGTF